MRVLCVGLLDCGSPVWSLPVHAQCLDASSAGRLAAGLLANNANANNTTVGATTRHVIFPELAALRAVVASDAPASLQRGPPAATAVVGDSNGALAIVATSTRASVSAAIPTLTMSAFGDEVRGALLQEAQEYVRGEDKLCASAAFVYQAVPANGNVAAFATSGSSSSSSSSSSSASIVTLWMMCQIAPDAGVMQHGAQRALGLASASAVLQRWAELALVEPLFQAVASAAPPVGTNRYSDALLGWIAAALEESISEFGDARHANLEPRYLDD